MHEATDGETVIDTSSLTAPTDAVNNGFAQPSGSELGALNLLQYKNKVKIASTIRPNMIQYIDYKISGASTIVLLVPAAEGEIFEVIVSDDSRSGTTAVDATPLVKTFTLPADTTDISVGPYQVGKYPSEQMGAVLVFVDSQLVYRTVGNQPDGEGDYIELPNIIRMVNTDPSDRQIVVVSHSALIESPEGSILSMIELLAGQIDGIIPTLAALAGVPETNFQSTPNNADLKAFGDRALQNEVRSLQNEADIAALPVISSGTWTPVFEAGDSVNVDSASGIQGFYTRIGNIVQCSINFNGDLTASNAATVIAFSGLPISSNFSATSSAQGAVNQLDTAAANDVGATVEGIVSSSKISVRLRATTSLGNLNYRGTFFYIIE